MVLYQTPVTLIGGQGGSWFSYDQSANGKIMTKIGVWAGESQLRGIRIWMSGSDDPTTFGTASGTYDEYTFADGEVITRLSLWGNGAGTRSGAIRFYTSTGGSFFPQMTSWGLQTEYPVDVVDGLCVGIQGRAGDDIDALAFLFLQSMTSARLINVNYPTLGLVEAGITSVTLDSYQNSNNSGSITMNWTFAGSQTVTVSESWTFAGGIEVHASVSVQAGIPIVAEVSGEFGWSLSATGSYTSTQEESRTLSWDQSGILEPGQWISLEATTRKGNITLPYEGTMEITLQSGTTFQYPISSTYSGVDYSNVTVVATGTRALDQAAEATNKEAQEGEQNVQPNKEVNK